MPTYEYRCLTCEHQFERFQRMSDDPVKECEVCGEPVKRLLFPVAIHFKGNGFYSTDYAKRNGLGTAGTSASNGGSSDDNGSGSSSDSSSKPDAGKSADSTAGTGGASGSAAASANGNKD